MLAGGAGSRFWPASRRAHPKPFVPLLGGETLFHATLGRLRPLADAAHTWVVSGRESARATRSALRQRRGVRLLLEPLARNTAAAIAWGAARVQALDPEAVVGVFPADHHIPDPARFVRAVRAAARVAARGEDLVLVGIEPTWPDTAYGYMQLGPRGPGATLRVRRFVEKPSRARARRFVGSGDYLWNAGMVVAKAELILRECRVHAPEVWRGLGPVLEAIAGRKRVSRAALERGYRRVRPIAFDRAVLERTRRVLAVRGRFRWSDLGSWDSLAEHLPAIGKNRVAGAPPVATLDSAGNLVWNRTRQALALLGVQDLVVVATPDSLFVCAKDRAQDVRQIVEELERCRRRDLT